MGAKHFSGLPIIILRKSHTPKPPFTSTLLHISPTTSNKSRPHITASPHSLHLPRPNHAWKALPMFPRRFCTSQPVVSALPSTGRKKKLKIRDAPDKVLRYRLDMCSKHGDLTEALSLYDTARAEGVTLNQYHYNVLLYLCSSAAMGALGPAYSRSDAKSEDQFDNFSPKISDPVRNLALKRGFEIYEQMGLDGICPNESTFTAAARLAVANEDGHLAFRLVKRMQDFRIPPRLRSYGPALFAFCNKRDAEMAYEVEAHMAAAGVQAEEAELGALLKVSVEVSREEKVYALLHRLRATVRQVSNDISKVIEGWFRKEETGRLGRSVWDREEIRGAVLARGGGWHGRGWLGHGNWRVEHTFINERGFCGCCRQRLVTIDIDPVETDSFARSVASLACEREAKAFQHFQEWLDKHGPFDAIVDGANVGLHKQTITSFLQLNAVVNGIQQRSPSKKLPLIILHQKRARGGPADHPRNKQLIEKWRNSGALYTTPTGSNDDWYWLYAAVRFKCLLVTNDEMRDHLFQLLGNSFFPKWKERHQVRFSVSRHNTQLHMPPPYSVVIQESETGSWHIPIVGGDDIETTREWLCITRCQPSELAQCHSLLQEGEFQNYLPPSDLKHSHGLETNKEKCCVNDVPISAARDAIPSNSSGKDSPGGQRKRMVRSRAVAPLSPTQYLHPRRMQIQQKLS